MRVHQLPTVLLLAALVAPTLPLATAGSIELVDAGYNTNQYVYVVFKNTGSEPVAVKSVYVDGDSYTLVTAEEMKAHPEKWNIPPGKWEGWTWVNPGEAFLYVQPIPPGAIANVTARVRVAHGPNTDHEVVVMFEDGSELRVKVRCPAGTFVMQASEFTEPWGRLTIFYEDGSNITISQEEHPEEYLKLLELMDRVVAEVVKWEMMWPGAPVRMGDKYIEATAIAGFFLAVPALFQAPYPPEAYRATIVFTGKYAGYVFLHEFDCCTSADVQWVLGDDKPLKELEAYIDQLPAILSGKVQPPPGPQPGNVTGPTTNVTGPAPQANATSPATATKPPATNVTPPQPAPAVPRDVAFYAACFLAAALLAFAAYKLAK